MTKISTASLWLVAMLCSAVAVAFVVIDDTHDQTVGGTKTHVFPDIGQVTFATLNVNVPADGQMQYCTDCQRNTEPCLGGGTGAMAIRRAGFWECLPGGGTCEITPTPISFACNTPDVVQAYNGNTAVTTCVTAGGGTPLPTSTPVPTDTPLIDLLYSGKLNLGANVSGTPLGLVSITAAATPAPHDRIIKCAPPNATPVAYTMPLATGSGRVIDMINTTGSGACSMARAGSDFLNDQLVDTLTNKWDADTCYDIGSAQWACRNLPTPTPTP